MARSSFRAPSGGGHPIAPGGSSSSRGTGSSLGFSPPRAAGGGKIPGSSGTPTPTPGSLTQQRIDTLAKIQRRANAAQVANSVDATPLGLVPTVSMSSTLPKAVPYLGNEGSYEVFGGVPLVTSAAGIFTIVDTDDSPLTSSTLSPYFSPAKPYWQHNGVWHFKLTNGRYLEVAMRETPNDVLRLFVNGVIANAGRVPYTVNAGTGINYVKFDLGAVGDYIIGIEVSGAVRFQGIAVEASATVSRANQADTITALMLGDSYTSGVAINTTTRGESLMATTARYLGIRNAITSGLVGAGMTVSGGRKTLPNYYTDTVRNGIFSAVDPDIIFLNAVFNDNGSQAPTIAASYALWQQMRADYPRALIIIGGVWTSPAQSLTTLQNREDGLKAQFDTWGDPFSIFVRSAKISSSQTNWMNGTGNSGTPTKTGINDYIVGSDNVHLTDGYDRLNGQWFVATKYRDAVIQGLNAFGTTYNPTAFGVNKWPLAMKAAGGSVPAGTVGTAYLLAIMSTGGLNSRTYSLQSGTLPAGLTLNANTGAITGTPTAAGSSTFTIRVTDGSTTADQAFTIVVS